MPLRLPWKGIEDIAEASVSAAVGQEDTDVVEEFNFLGKGLCLLLRTDSGRTRCWKSHQAAAVL